MSSLPPKRPSRNVAGAIYGLILGSSVIVAAATDHPRQVGLVEVYLCVTAVVFYLAHVYAQVIGRWIEGEAPTAAAIRHQLYRERPMVAAQLLPALLLLLGVAGILGGRVAITVAVIAALAELMAGVTYACLRARATPRQAALSIGTAALFATIVILLKVFVHG